MKTPKFLCYFIATCILVAALIGPARIAFFAQRHLHIHKTIFMGCAMITRPDTWALSYFLTHESRVAFIYGLIPVLSAREDSDETIYIFDKTNDAGGKVIFSELSDSLSKQGRKVLEKIKNKQISIPYYTSSLFGFDALIRKEKTGLSEEYAISIPDLSLYIITESLENLHDFKVTTTQPKGSDSINCKNRTR